MADTLPTIFPTTQLGSVLNKITQNIAKEKIVKSNDFNSSQMAGGNKLGLKRKHKPSFSGINYKGELNVSGGYAINSEIRVLGDKNYGVPASPGVWIACAYVPSQYFTEGVSTLSNIDPSRIRKPNVNYFPQWPEPANLPTADNPNGRYWEFVGFMPSTMSVCIEGTNRDFYAGVFPSGSLPT